ncbi:TRAP transporter small permease subunit [Hydrogenophaga sp.]|uniref:TRAP transporter small permease subunit n=1 Tax=Hydrogenophaga sp. TaxID=1904254 RepID=UPI002FC849CF
MSKLLQGIESLSQWDGWIGVACLTTLIALMVAELAVRALSNVFPSLPGGLPHTWEYCSYLMAASFTFGAAMTLRTGGHIRVQLLLCRLGPGARRALETLTSLIGLLSVSFLSYSMARFTWTSFVSGQVSAESGTLLWMPQLAVTFGILLLALQLLARVIQALAGLPLEDGRMKPTAPLE